MTTRILGLNLSHDSSVCLVEDGEILAALALERTSRVKRGTVPLHAYASAMMNLTREVLAGSNLEPNDVDHWVVTSTESRDGDDESRLSETLGLLVPPDRKLTLPHPGHHLAHASAAHYTSGFTEAAVLVIDAYGSLVNGGRERETGFFFQSGKKPQKVYSSFRDSGRIAGRIRDEKLWTPADLSGIGEVYRVVTLALGFREQGTTYDDAGKTMGLASYGKRLSKENLFIDVEPTGLSFGRTVESLVQLGLAKRIGDQFQLVPRSRGAALSQFHKNVAAQIQHEFEEACLYLVREVLRLAETRSLALAGGCFLNSSLNTRIAYETDQLFIFPAATDDGNAAGAALYAYHHLIDGDRRDAGRTVPRLRHVHLGPPRLSSPTATDVTAIAARYNHTTHRHPDLATAATAAATAVARGEIVGWFQDRGEFGPRSLGARSILCHPGLPGMKDTLNARVKFRESFRPFAASVLAEHVKSWFELPLPDSPFMLTVCPVHADRRATISEVVHVDGTCRIQTVDADLPGNFRVFLEAFEAITGLPLVLNTSFNLRGMPIVEKPEESIDCLYGSRIDRLFIGEFELLAPDFESLSPRKLSVEAPPETTEVDRRILELADGSRTTVEIADLIAEDADTVVDLLLDLRRRGFLDWVGSPPRLRPEFPLPQYDPTTFAE